MRGRGEGLGGQPEEEKIIPSPRRSTKRPVWM